MNPTGQVFISYKREDEPRVARLVKALEGSGFTVWWDRNLPHDQSWRSHVLRELEASGCVVVVWTEASVAVPQGGSFVVEEAAEAKRRGTLLAVRLDRVLAPLGFRESGQPVDLMHWKGNRADPFFVDLCDAIRAKLEGRMAPVPQGHRRRWLRRLAWGGIGGTLLSGSLVFSLPIFVPPELVCTVNILQPGLSDFCGAVGIGRRPSRAERLAWNALEPGSCPALRRHVELFKEGYYRAQAADLLTARRLTQVERWIPGSRELALYVGGDSSAAAASSEASAREAAEARGQLQAERLCKSFVASALYRFVSARTEITGWNCTREGRGVSCSGEGKAICALEERHVEEKESC